MDFYEQHAYDEDSEAMNELIMKLVVATEQMVELKSMIFAREQTQAMNSYNPWPINEINTYEQLVSPSLKEAFNNIMQSIQQLWDEAATMPSYGEPDQHINVPKPTECYETIPKLMTSSPIGPNNSAGLMLKKNQNSSKWKRVARCKKITSDLGEISHLGKRGVKECDEGSQSEVKKAKVSGVIEQSRPDTVEVESLELKNVLRKEEIPPS
ncbi:hypothetical protein LWI29_032765 [Acer saccharum]|uniref:Uncharacterized protein n=1 Tax=Acer saccharum TaxID=4024 RepID=A0AA39RPV0_ACESA|nr:hypothetical protein LWI29_032765 [Acer saccharum]